MAHIISAITVHTRTQRTFSGMKQPAEKNFVTRSLLNGFNSLYQGNNLSIPKSMSKLTPKQVSALKAQFFALQ